MLPDSLPLISANTLNAASAPARTEAGQTDGRRLSAEVTARQPDSKEGSQLTLKVGDQTLTVSSKLPLPLGTRLQLLLTESQGKPALMVQDIQLPPAATTTGNTAGNTAVTQNATAVQTLQQQLNSLLTPAQPIPAAAISRLLSSRLPLLAQAPAGNTQQSGLYRQTSTATATPGSTTYTAAAATGSGQPTTSAAQLIGRLLAALPSPVSPDAGSAIQAEQGAVKQPLTLSGQSPLPSAPATSTDIPRTVQQILQQWQQQLPAPQQLATPQGVQDAVRNSGLSFEQKLLALASQIRQQAALPPTGNAAAAGGQPGSTVKNDNSPTALFRQLWQKAAALSPAATSAETSPDGGSKAAGVLDSILGQVRSRLENNSDSLSPQLRQLLHSDYKGVISRALLLWLNQTKPADAAPQRDLPLSLQAAEPGSHFRLLQTALAQTETEQIQRLQQGPEQQLNIPLFYRDGDRLQETRLQISRDDSDNEQADGQKKRVSWRLRLHFDLQHLGPLDVEVSMTLPQLSATFWSEQQDTLAGLSRELQPLRDRLQAMGVEVSELDARFGRLPENSRNQIQQRLIDTHS